MRKPTIVVGSDHAGFGLKRYVITLLEKEGYRVVDKGTDGPGSVDYPDFAEAVGKEMASRPGSLGILSCGTGIGISIAANKLPGIREALVRTPREARLSREHNDANVLVLPGRPWRKKNTGAAVRAWLKAPFAGGRHGRRVRKIAVLEKTYGEERPPD
ncbi:MAG TPA: RpiB/LacA/LacB family sugar-phosphate isomerase [bacterium]|nr:RpiB/LacA/LacB family sugar-phosphate isomerase [bacterium]